MSLVFSWNFWWLGVSFSSLLSAKRRKKIILEVSSFIKRVAMSFSRQLNTFASPASSRLIHSYTQQVIVVIRFFFSSRSSLIIDSVIIIIISSFSLFIHFQPSTWTDNFAIFPSNHVIMNIKQSSECPTSKKNRIRILIRRHQTTVTSRRFVYTCAWWNE